MVHMVFFIVASVTHYLTKLASMPMYADGDRDRSVRNRGAGGAATRRPLLYAGVAAAFTIVAVNKVDLWGPLGALDIDAAWSAGRALISHQNPYEVIGPTGVYHYPWTFYYPLTVGALALPLALLPYQVARVVFLLLAGGVFGYAVGRTRPWAWPLILCEPFVNAIRTAQWSPLLAASLMLPLWGAISAVKPNVAVALFFGARSRTQVVAMVVGGVVLVGLAIVLRPSWPIEWYERVHQAENFLRLTPGGIPHSGWPVPVA